MITQNDLARIYANQDNCLITQWLIVADCTQWEQLWGIRQTKLSYEDLAKLSYCKFFQKKEEPKTMILQTYWRMTSEQAKEQFKQFLKDMERGNIDKWVALE